LIEGEERKDKIYSGGVPLDDPEPPPEEE